MKKKVCIILSIIFSSLLFAEIPIVRDISAEAGKNKKINILWSLPETPSEEITELLVYRNTKQISSYDQIRTLTPIISLPGNTTAYTDTVEDFSDYFYAVVAVTTKPYDLILLSFNSTVSGVHLKSVVQKTYTEQKEEEKLYPEGTLREIPLPYIDITDSINDNEVISDSVAEGTYDLAGATNAKQDILKPYIFEEDLISPDGGDDYLLFNILKTTFVRRKYKEAVAQLEKLAGTNINETTRKRAYFYLGESYYFLGNYKDAVKTFVRVESCYPSLVKEWLNSSLDKI